MEKVVRRYGSFEEADAADREFYKSLSGNERLDILLELVRQTEGFENEFKKVYRIINLRDSHNS